MREEEKERRQRSKENIAASTRRKGPIAKQTRKSHKINSPTTNDTEADRNQKPSEASLQQNENESVAKIKRVISNHRKPLPSRFLSLAGDTRGHFFFFFHQRSINVILRKSLTTHHYHRHFSLLPFRTRKWRPRRVCNHPAIRSTISISLVFAFGNYQPLLQYGKWWLLSDYIHDEKILCPPSSLFPFSPFLLPRPLMSFTISSRVLLLLFLLVCPFPLSPFFPPLFPISFPSASPLASPSPARIYHRRTATADNKNAPVKTPVRCAQGYHGSRSAIFAIAAVFKQARMIITGLTDTKIFVRTGSGFQFSLAEKKYDGDSDAR